MIVNLRNIYRRKEVPTQGFDMKVSDRLLKPHWGLIRLFRQLWSGLKRAKDLTNPGQLTRQEYGCPPLASSNNQLYDDAMTQSFTWLEPLECWGFSRRAASYKDAQKGPSQMSREQ